MTKWTDTDHALFSTIAKMTQKGLHKSMRNYLKKYYPKNNIRITKDYIMCEGNIPVMFVAHMDTVFKFPPQHIYYDAKQAIMWSPDGLGADDRAGVYLIWRIIQSGYRPHICLTTDEEKGSLGAIQLVLDYPTCPYDLKYIVELDRQGTNDCVFYSCANKEFAEFVENYGFVTDWGTFSDISEICPAWRIAGVNLSVGYKNEHSAIETLNTRAMMDTYNKVIHMIEDIQNDDVPYFKYIPDPYEKYYYNLGRKYLSKYYDYGYPEEEEIYGYRFSSNIPSCQCVKCKKVYDESDVFPVKSRNGNGTRYYCLDCVSTGVNWCAECGEPFETENDNENICPDCLNRTQAQVQVG